VWRTYYFLGLISQTIFRRFFSFAHFTGNQVLKKAERMFYQQIKRDEGRKTATRENDIKEISRRKNG